jgi:hypothetical protein
LKHSAIELLLGINSVKHSILNSKTLRQSRSVNALSRLVAMAALTAQWLTVARLFKLVSTDHLSLAHMDKLPFTLTPTLQAFMQDKRLGTTTAKTLAAENKGYRCLMIKILEASASVFLSLPQRLALKM